MTQEATTPRNTMYLDQLVASPDLSWKAKAIAIAIAANRDKFANPEIKDKIRLLVGMGRDRSVAVRTMLRELSDYGLLVQTTIRHNVSPAYIKGNVWEIGVVLENAPAAV